ncbi:MAG: hypothetical protein AAB664_00140, partial [Patescibacteria group bacterium]
MKEKLLQLVTKWRFWLSFQFLLILILIIIGHVRERNALDRIFGSRFGEAFIGFIGTILGFPSGIYFFFTEKIPNNSVFMAYVLPAIYYPIFFFLVWYVTKQKRNWKLIAI